MRTITIEGVEHRLDCNALTPFYYSEQFLVNRDGHMVCEDINDAIASIIAAVDAGGIPPMLKMQQLFWAFEKTASPDTIAGFKEWVVALPTSTIALTTNPEWAETVVDMVKEFFLPTEAGEDVGATTTGEPTAATAG